MKKTPDISKQIYKEEVLSVLEDKYSIIGPYWSSAQLEWLNGSFRAFNDHDKYLIIIYLKKKTLDFYSRNFIKFTYDEFYKKSSFEIEKLSVKEISMDLNIPKESTRRKIDELQKEGIIKKSKNRFIIDRSMYTGVTGSKWDNSKNLWYLTKPIKTIQRISRFLSKLSQVLEEDKILPQSFKSEDIETIIKKNFSYTWKLYYEFEIPLMIKWKFLFNDLESFHIWGICAVNDQINNKIKNISINNREDFISDMFKLNDIKYKGINAMSVSDISGIPRATVIRKLNKLVKNNFLIINNQKHYKVKRSQLKKTMSIHKDGVNQLANFSQLIYNIIIANED
jgi:DNA-binding Lrp family transcriptional regulator